MAEPLKHMIRRETLAPVAQAIAATAAGFDPMAFLGDACTGLEALELKARINHVADALQRHLDPHVPTALAQLRAALPDGLDGTDALVSHFAWWSVLSYVERHATAHPAEALPALQHMTAVWSAEFAVRPFLDADLEGTLAVLRSWLTHPSAHVRRLVSEGTRPRLPWGMRVRGLMGAPAPTVDLLTALRRDPELYVRRSVANHVGDIAKDQPDLAVSLVAGWVAADDTDETRWIARHGLRHLVKKGHPGALAVLGFGPPAVRCTAFHVEPAVFTVGGSLEITAGLVSESDEEQPLVVDLVVGFQKARAGRITPKTFKWTTPTLAAGGSWNAVKRLPLKPVSTRRYHPGRHTVALQVNGQVVAEGEFELRLPDA
jgi:3-methyladenine DNA glycosylase AlkC